MESTSFERGKVLKKNRNERSDILSCLLGGTLCGPRSEMWEKEGRDDVTYNCLAVLCIREANTNGLVNKENIGVAIPRFFEERWVLGRIGNPTGP